MKRKTSCESICKLYCGANDASRSPHDLDHRTAHDHIRCNMTKDEELERLYKAYDEQHEMFKQLYYKQAEAHRYQLDVIWSVLDFHWQVIKVRLK